MATHLETNQSRFSTGLQDKTHAPTFPWEHPVPDTPFWRTFAYPTARNILQSFSAADVASLQLDSRYGTSTHAEKLGILASIVRERITTDEGEGEGDGGERTPLWERDHAKWQKYMLALSGIYSEQGDEEKLSQTLNSLIEHRVDTSNLSFHHGLAGLLVKQGEFARAEELEREVMPWLDGQLGRDSPQSMSSRRIMVKALVGQGRKREAGEMLAEIRENIGVMEKGQFAMYVDDEVMMTEEVAGSVESMK